MEMYGDFLGFEHLYDARIRTEDGAEFPVHRILLATKSEYFHNLLCFEAPKETDILVPDIQGSTMKIIIDYIYNGDTKLDGHNTLDILLASYYLGIERLFDNSRLQAIRNLSINNVIPLFRAAWKIEKLGILKPCTRFIVINFEPIVRDPSSKFVDLPVEALEMFLKLDNLNTPNEYQVWRSIVCWISNDPNQRTVHLKKLIQFVRFQKKDCDDLISEVLGHPFVKDSSDYDEIQRDILNRDLPPEKRTPNSFYVFTKFYISRSDFTDGIKIYITYDEDIDAWRHISSSNFCPDVILFGAGAVVVLFDTHENAISTFDLISKTWSTLASPSTPRKEYSVLKLGNYIYALGGLVSGDDADEILTAVERYNFDSGEWEYRNSLSPFTQGMAVAVDNRICVVGSWPGFFNESLVAQFYDSSKDIWESLHPPNTYRRQFAFVVFRNKLYVMGGHSSEGFLKSVEVYDEEEDVWNEFEDLPFAYFLPRAVVINDTLYVYDNHSDDHDFRCPPVSWDENEEKWHVVEASSPFCDLHIYQFCVVDDAQIISEMLQENRDPCTKWSASPFFPKK